MQKPYSEEICQNYKIDFEKLKKTLQNINENSDELETLSQKTNVKIDTLLDYKNGKIELDNMPITLFGALTNNPKRVAGITAELRLILMLSDIEKTAKQTDLNKDDLNHYKKDFNSLFYVSLKDALNILENRVFEEITMDIQEQYNSIIVNETYRQELLEKMGFKTDYKKQSLNDFYAELFLFFSSNDFMLRDEDEKPVYIDVGYFKTFLNFASNLRLNIDVSTFLELLTERNISLIFTKEDGKDYSKLDDMDVIINDFDTDFLRLNTMTIGDKIIWSPQFFDTDNHQLTYKGKYLDDCDTFDTDSIITVSYLEKDFSDKLTQNIKAIKDSLNINELTVRLALKDEEPFRLILDVLKGVKITNFIEEIQAAISEKDKYALLDMNKILNGTKKDIDMMFELVNISFVNVNSKNARNVLEGYIKENIRNTFMVLQDYRQLNQI
jgi:hypothetical protein